MFVAKAVTTGSAPWSPALDTNTGEAAVYAPMDHGLPADGVVARTRGDEVWAFAELDIEALTRNESEAQVAVDRDWDGQRRFDRARVGCDTGPEKNRAGSSAQGSQRGLSR